MATVKPSDIAKLAQLARIAVSEQQAGEVASRITDVLNLVDQLQAADTDGVEPMAHPLDAVQRLRADQVTEQNRREAFHAIAPAVEDGLYLVPRVIEE
jgi:aspartyl-tRNA(Asn)/glutamyl-tRNA(Gln) amidotransferase subunit C